MISNCTHTTEVFDGGHVINNRAHTTEVFGGGHVAKNRSHTIELFGGGLVINNAPNSVCFLHVINNTLVPVGANHKSASMLAKHNIKLIIQ